MGAKGTRVAHPKANPDVNLRQGRGYGRNTAFNVRQKEACQESQKTRRLIRTMKIPGFSIQCVRLVSPTLPKTRRCMK